MTAAYAPTTTSNAATIQLLVAIGLICAILGGAYLWAAIRTALAERHAAILTAYTEPQPVTRRHTQTLRPRFSDERKAGPAATGPAEPLNVEPPGAQRGRHRADLIEHDTCPISMADVRRAELARGATR